MTDSAGSLYGQSSDGTWHAVASDPGLHNTIPQPASCGEVVGLSLVTELPEGAEAHCKVSKAEAKAAAAEKTPENPT